MTTFQPVDISGIPGITIVTRDDNKEHSIKKIFSRINDSALTDLLMETTEGKVLGFTSVHPAMIKADIHTSQQDAIMEFTVKKSDPSPMVEAIAKKILEASHAHA